MANTQLRRAFNQLDLIKQDRSTLIPALLGFLINGVETVEVGDRPGYNYARMRSNFSEMIVVFNDRVSPVYDLPVLLERDPTNPTRYRVVGRDVGRYENWGSSSSFLPKHGGQHSFNPDSGMGGDTVWIYSKQILPWLVAPSGTTGAGNVVIHGHPHYANSHWGYWGATGTASLLGYSPSGSYARMVLVYFDGSGNPQLSPGATFAATTTGSSTILSYLPATPAEGIPLAGILLVSGTSSVTWNNIYDVRPFFSHAFTSSSGSSSTPPDTHNLIVQWDYSENTILTYPATNEGFDDAMTALGEQDTLWLPFGSFAGNYTLPNYVTIIGATPYGCGDTNWGCQIVNVTEDPIFTAGYYVTLQNLTLECEVNGTEKTAVALDADNKDVFLSNVNIYAWNRYEDGGAIAIANCSEGVIIDGGYYHAQSGIYKHYPFDSTPDGYHIGLNANNQRFLYSNGAHLGDGTNYLDIDTSGRMTLVGAAHTKVKTSTADVSNPPTDAELDSAFGTPGSLGTGFVGLINDAGSGTANWLCWSDGGSWFYAAGTKAV